MHYAEGHPGFHHVLKSEWISLEIRTAVRGLHNAMIGAIAELIGSTAPRLNADQRLLHAEAALGITDGLLPIVMAAQGERRNQLAGELKRALTLYLEVVMG